MAIKVGDKIPSVTLKRLGEGGMEDLNIADYIAKKKVVIFAVPGAFTPACSQKHLPGYIEHAKDIKAKGIDEIICIAVNDPFVMQHWGESAGAKGKVTMIPDGNGEFTKAVGLDFDGSGYGLATRSKRYSMVVENGKVTKLSVEEKPSDVELSGAQACAANL